MNKCLFFSVLPVNGFLSFFIPYLSSINPLKTGNPKKGTLENSVDQDEMPLYGAFHQGLHCLLRQNQSSEKEIQYFLEILT